MQGTRRTLILAIGALGCSIGIHAAAHAAAKLQTADHIPAGFEQLETPRYTHLTLYYGGELIGTVPAWFTPTTLQFAEPAHLLAAIPGLTDPAAIAQALAAPLPANADKLCGTRPREGCGTLAPEMIGVIFDEATLTAELFVNRNQLSVREQNTARYLPLPAQQLSSVFRFDGAVSGTSGADPVYALSNQSIVAFGEGSLNTRTTLSDSGVRFDTISADLEREGWSRSAGLIRSMPMQLAGDRDIAGFSYGTSLRTRLDVRKTEGNELIVYLPRQSFVSIYREGRLYSARSYEAGNQKLDTTELPDGAYNVTLKIQEVGGDMREETRFFAKSEQLPPPDAPTYYLQAGVMREPFAADATVPRLTGKPLLRAGTVQRIDDHVGLGIAALGLSDRAAAEASAFLLAGGTQLRASALASTAGDAGLQFSTLYIDPRWSASLDARKLWAGDALPVTYSGIINGITQATASSTYFLTPTVDLALRASYARPDGMQSVTSFGPALSWRMWQEGESMVYLSADAARIDGDNQATALVRFSYRFGSYGVTGESGYGSGRGAAGAFGSGRIWHASTTPDESLLVGAGVRHDRQSDSINADADWRGQLGRMRGAVQHARGDMSVTNYGGTFALGAAQVGDMLALGGSEADMSAVAIDTAGEAGAALTIYVNNTPRGTLAAGERRVLYLPPYMSYRIRVAPAKGSMVRVEGGERKVTLYPGNVVHLAWQATAFSVISGRVADAAGAPLADAVLDGTAIRTDDSGRFQAELAHTETLHFTTAEGTACTAALPAGVAARNGVYLYREPLRCE